MATTESKLIEHERSSTTNNGQDAADAAPDRPPIQGELLAKTQNSVELNHALSDINHYVQSFQRELIFDIDQESGKSIVKVLDSNTHELIRQFPPEQALKMAQALHHAQENIGKIFDDRA